MPSLPLVARRVVVLAAFAAALASGQGAARADRVALEDGTHVVGTATVDSASKIVTVAYVRGGVTLRQKVPLAKVLAVEGADGGLAWIRGPERLLDACKSIGGARRRERLVTLAREAVSAGDAALGEKWLDEAVALGAAGSEVDAVRALARGATARKAPRQDARVVAATATHDALPREEAAWTWTEIRARATTLTPEAHMALIERVLSLDATHASAMAFLESTLPPELTGRIEAKAWLRFSRDLRGHVTVRLPPAEGTPERLLEPVAKEMGRARDDWNKDVIGLEGKHVLVVTRPPLRRGAADALVAGEGVLGALADLFRTDAPKNTNVSTLPAYLYRESFEFAHNLTPSQRGYEPDVDPDAKDPVIGFWDSDAGVVKYCWPDQTTKPPLVRAFSSSLVSFWLDSRCPRWGEGSWSRREFTALGCWAYDGIPRLFTEGSTDPSTGVWAPAGLASRRRKEIRLLATSGLILPWASVLGADFAARYHFSRAPRVAPDGTRASILAAYLAQATAATEVLYGAERGRYRTGLADVLAGLNLGTKEGVSVGDAFHLSAEAIGARVEAWAAD